MATTNELYNAAMKLKDRGQPEAAIEKLGELLAEDAMAKSKSMTGH